MGRRTRAGESSGSGPVPISQLVDHALRELQSGSALQVKRDGILYAGNRQECAPRALFLDRRLTPLERNAWQVFRMHLNGDGITAFPTYDELRPYLASMPCSGHASDETIARALTLLRLTRWLTLARHCRHPATGRIHGNLYVLHDESLTPYEAIQLDPHYLELISQALIHASVSIQRVGTHALTELTQDPMLSGRILPSRIHLILDRVVRSVEAAKSPSSESEDGEALQTDRLRNPKTVPPVRTVRDDYIKEEDVRTVPRVREAPSFQVPERFTRLHAEQRSGALAALERVEPGLRQLVLNEWDARCRVAAIRNPAGYLFGIIQKALRGDFHATKGAPTGT